MPVVDMKYAAKENKIKRTAKSPSPDAKSADAAEQKATKAAMKSGRMFSQSSKGRSSVGADGGEGEDYSILTLRYEINDKGVGKILLPPSLSTLLQSERVSISPSAGGLFIRSI
jgi:hypothetical protein